jgi:hypothetical protein
MALSSRYHLGMEARLRAPPKSFKVMNRCLRANSVVPV